MKRWSVVAMLAIMAAFLCTPAHALIEIKISDGTTTIDLKDGDPGDTCAAVNCVTFNGVIGQWNINVDTGTSKDASDPNIMDLAFTAHHNAAAAGTGTTLTITLSDNGFTGMNGFLEQLGGTQNAGGTVTAQLFGAINNTKFDTTNPLGPKFSTSVSPMAFTGSAPGTLVNPFSLTQVLTLSYGDVAGLTTGDWSVARTPEPASVAMFGGMLLATFGAIRRRVRR